MDKLKYYIDLYTKKEHFDMQYVYDNVIIPNINEIAQNISTMFDNKLTTIEFIEELFSETFYYVVINILNGNKHLIDKNDTWYHNIILIEAQKYKYYSNCYRLIFTVGQNVIIDNILLILSKKKNICKNRINIIYNKCIEDFPDYFDNIPEINKIVDSCQ